MAEAILNSTTEVNCLDDERIIFLTDDINMTTGRDIASKIIKWNLEDDEKDKKEKNFKRKSIKIHINSYGGMCDAAEQIISAIRLSKAKVDGYCFGIAASAAFVVLVACDKRYGSVGSQFLYHQVSGWMYGTTKEREISLDVTKKQNEIIDKFVLERTRIPKSIIKGIHDNNKNWVVFGEDALKYGIIHKVL